MSGAAGRRLAVSRAATLAAAAGLWVAPLPAGLTEQAWHLFAIFAAAIL